MARIVEINLGRGNLSQGFPLILVRLDQTIQLIGNLPPLPKLQEIYQQWQFLYQSLYQCRRFALRQQLIIDNDDDDDFEIEEDEITDISENDFLQVCCQLENTLNEWLEEKSFLNIERKLRQHLSPDEEIIFILEAEDYFIKKIPWHIWQFFNDYPLAEIALSNLDFEPKATVFNKHNKVKILAILGDSTGINVENDRQILSQLQQAETTFLVQPSREELFSQLWQEEGWDIFFFSGHSESNEDDYTGYIYLNQQEKLSIGQLKNAVEKAQNNGLQLAIFNSCDGLGLGKELADLSIPETILMREPVADQVAQKFLEYFLTIFSSGQSLYLSVKEARKRLQGIENNFPGASWLPVIWQNPATIPFLWRDLCFNSQTLKRRISKILSVCLGILTLLFNWLGFKPNSAKAEEILANNSPENLANYLQQQSLDLQQLSDYLVEEDSNNIPLFESNLVQSLQQISEQLKTNQIPSLSQINQIQNELKQINSNLLLEDENRLLTDTEIENTSNPNISQFQPENQTSQNNNNFNNDNNPIENESKISFQLDDNEKVNNDNLIADLVETIENNLKQINTEIEEINNQLDDFNQSQNLSLDNLGETEIKLQKYEQQLAENFEDNLEIMKNFAESITALDNFNNIELSLGKEKDMQLENLVINFSNLSHNWQSKSENISQNCNSLTDYISVTITDNKSIFINTVLSQLSQSLNNYQPKVNEIILLLESQKLEINNLFEQILDSKINWYKEYFSQTKIKIVNNLHKKYNWFIEENFTFHQVLANNNDRLVIITTNLPKKTENLSMLGDKIKREIVADNFLIFPDYAKISEQLFLISDNLANISNLSTKVNLQLEVFN